MVPRLELNIDVDSRAPTGDEQVHVAGTVRHEDGQELPFVGWVGLLGLLQQALTQ